MRVRQVTGAFAVMLWTTGAVAMMPDLVGNDLAETIAEHEVHVKGMYSRFMVPTPAERERAFGPTSSWVTSGCFGAVEMRKTSVSPQLRDKSDLLDDNPPDASCDDSVDALDIIEIISKLEGIGLYDKVTSTHYTAADRASYRRAMGAITCHMGLAPRKTPTSPRLLDRRSPLNSGLSDTSGDGSVVALTTVATASDFEGPTPYEKATTTPHTTTQHTPSSTLSVITSSSFDQQSQTLVATTAAPVPIPDGPTCDADGNCVFPPFCTVHFGEYIMCEGEYTTPSPTRSASTSDTPTSPAVISSSSSQSLLHKSGKESTSSMKPGPLSTASSTRTKSTASKAVTTRSLHRLSSSTTSTKTHAVDDGKAATSTVYITQAITVTVIAQPIISVYGTSNTNDRNTDSASESSSIAVPASTLTADIGEGVQLTMREIIDALLTMDNVQSADDAIDTEHALRIAARQDVSLLVAAIEAVAALENTTDVIGERDALGQQDVDSIVEVWSTVTASPSIVYVNEATATSSYNVTGVVYETQTQAISDAEPVATVAIVVTKSVTASNLSGSQSATTPTKQLISTTSTITRNITLTDPINPHITTVVPLVPLGTSRAHFNNTSIDTEVYLNISTFSATGLSHASSHLTTISEALTATSATSVVVTPSMTTTTQSGDENGMVGYTPAMTSDVGKAQSSAATIVIQASGSCLAVLAGIALAAVLGLFMLL